MRDGDRFPLLGSRDAYPTRGGLGDKPDPRVPESDSAQPNQIPASRAPAPYVELHAHSSYSFLDGASLPEELAVQAAELGYPALALTDHDGVYGSLEFAHAAKHFGVHPITGAEVTLADRSHVTLLVETQQGYANLCRLLTAAHAHTPPPGKESQPPPGPALGQGLLEELNDGLVCLSGCARHGRGVRNPNG